MARRRSSGSRSPALCGIRGIPPTHSSHLGPWFPRSIPCCLGSGKGSLDSQIGPNTRHWWKMDILWTSALVLDQGVMKHFPIPTPRQMFDAMIDPNFRIHKRPECYVYARNAAEGRGFGSPTFGQLWFSLRTYPFQTTKRSQKRDIFKISNAFPHTWHDIRVFEFVTWVRHHGQ